MTMQNAREDGAASQQEPHTPEFVWRRRLAAAEKEARDLELEMRHAAGRNADLLAEVATLRAERDSIQHREIHAAEVERQELMARYVDVLGKLDDAVKALERIKDYGTMRWPRYCEKYDLDPVTAPIQSPANIAAATLVRIRPPAP